MNKKGGNNNLSEHDYIVAYNIAWEGLVELDALIGESNGSSKAQDLLKNRGFLNQEEILIKKDLFEKLSEEAKEVIKLIINSPQEIFECFLTKKYRIVSRDLIKKYLFDEKGWSAKKIARCFRELKKYTEQFSEIGT